jgi:Ca-activated chloride channel family protein
MRPTLFVCQLQTKKFLSSAASFLLVAVLTILAPAVRGQSREDSAPQTPGALQALDTSGKQRGLCPLKHTDVSADIAGSLARVTVTQDFENPFEDKIEAVYTFPLPQAAAVDDMTMQVGDRTVKGKVMRREQAQAVYEAARQNGRVAGLLDQERPNIFTQSVANIMPGEHVKITISYVETLKYEDGEYEFSFPMVVEPRYVPGAPTGGAQKDEARLPGTDRVPDASRISPPVAREGTRAGHDISVAVSLDAGVPLESVKSVSHEVEVERPSPSSARVRLKDSATIPNKDFVLRYDVAGRKIEDALLTHRDERGGYFTLILQPPDRISVEDVTPKELVFVLDTSGSMSGFPIEKAKETMKLALDGLYPQDTFNLITFSGDEHILFPEPVPATPENLAKAEKFLESREGSGGTEMMKAVKAALDPSDASGHVRIVCFMTDGYVGNDMEIISEVQKHPNARVFSFGIGSAVNHFLLDKMAEYGRGEVEYVSLGEDGSAAARRFHERVRNPLLTDIQIDWGGLPVADVYPKRIPDLFGAKPVILSGRFTGGGRGVIRITGNMAGRKYEREIAVTLPEAQPEHDELATLWARHRVDDLMGEDFAGMQRGQTRVDIRDAITNVGLEYRLMTQFTSFVAVEEMTVTDGGPPRRVEVPIELPEGVTPDVEAGEARGFGIQAFAGRRIRNAPAILANRPPTVTLNATVQPTPAQGETEQVNVVSQSALMSLADVKELSRNGRADASAPAKLTPEEERARAVREKLDASLAAIVERLGKKEVKPGEDESAFVRDGKAEIQIWLTEKSPEVLAELKQLGFEVLLDPKTANLVIGRLPVEKLPALVDIKAVRYVAPQR